MDKTYLRMDYNTEECKGCFYAQESENRCILKEPKRETRCRTVWAVINGHNTMAVEPRNKIKEE